MKKALLIFLSLSILLLLSGCCLSHEWVEADCITPKICTKCGETEGEALGHQWKDATCTDAKACAVCAVTEGEPLGHSFEKEEIRNPDYVAATATFVQTCSGCGKQTERAGKLESIISGKHFLMTPEEFSDRFTSMMMKNQHLLGDDQYLSFIDEEAKAGNLKMYLCQRNPSGTIRVVGEFEMLDTRGQLLLPEEHTKADKIREIRGKVRGDDPRRQTLISLVCTVDPTKEDDWDAIDRVLGGWQDTILRDDDGTCYVPFDDFLLEIQQKGSTCNIAVNIR